jgi:hypothetical protein
MMFHKTESIHFVVMAGLDPAIHETNTWMPGTRSGMTVVVVHE